MNYYSRQRRAHRNSIPVSSSYMQPYATPSYAPSTYAASDHDDYPGYEPNSLPSRHPRPGSVTPPYQNLTPPPPPTLPPAQHSEKGPEHLTISDDRSAGSNLEVRNLLALKDRNPSDQLRGPPGPVPSDYMSNPFAPSQNPFAPQGYFQDAAPHHPSAQWSHVPPQTTTDAFDRHNESYQTYPAYPPPIPAIRQPFGSAQMEQRFGHLQFESETACSDTGNVDENAATRDTIPNTTFEKSGTHGYQTLKLDHSWVEGIAATTTSDRSHVEDTTQAGIESLQQQIAVLQDSLRRLENQKQTETPKPYHVLYRVNKSSYFDHPEWTQGNKSIVSRVRVQNLDLFLERNKSILFIVYQDFDVTPKSGNRSTSYRPAPSRESIYVVNRNLRGAIEILLQSHWRYQSFYADFYSSGEIRAPFLFIYHNRHRWLDMLSEFSHHVREKLAVLARYVSHNYGHEYAAADALFKQRKVSVNFVKYLFQPGDILVLQKDGQRRGLVAQSWPEVIEKGTEVQEPEGSGTDEHDEWDDDESDTHVPAPPKVSHFLMNFTKEHKKTLFAHNKKNEPGRKTASITKSSKEFLIHVSKWSYDGDFKRERDQIILGMSREASSVPLETVEWDIHDLNVYPLRLAPKSVVDKLRCRGTMFWQCRKRCLISYQEIGPGVQEESDERFMIDFHTFRKLHPENKSHTIFNPLETMSKNEMDQDEPPDEAFYYLVPLQTKGFNLRTKKWLDLNMDQIQPSLWNTKAFDTLVLDRKTKELITALVSKQISYTKSTDVIAGKGNGLILLLHGGPGTGKTLTAEGVAEIAKKPLYRVTCGDVGTKAEDVEKYLESVLHLGKIWDCVVLLDEAEVFLERRSLDDLQRNALVSVFLRVIEYHEGILILTSNRVGTFDEAFRSRIQIAVHYPPLRSYQRLQIWKNFIDRLESFNDGAVDVDNLRDHLEDLQKIEINGRQIRNAITTARQYADWKGKVMNYEHLTTALEVAGKFDAYSEKLRGGLTDDQIAEEEGIR